MSNIHHSYVELRYLLTLSVSLIYPFITKERCYVQKLTCRYSPQQEWQWRSAHW